MIVSGVTLNCNIVKVSVDLLVVVPWDWATTPSTIGNKIEIKMQLVVCPVHVSYHHLYLRVSETSIPNTKLNARRFRWENVFGSIPGICLVDRMDDFTVGDPSDRVILPFYTVSVEVSSKVLTKIDISAMGNTFGGIVSAAVPPVVFLDRRRLSVEVVRGTMN